MEKKEHEDDDGMLMEYLLNIVGAIIAPKPLRKLAQKIIDKLNKE